MCERSGNVDAIDRLLSPHTLEEFLESHFEQNPLLIRRGRADYFQPILTMQDLDHALSALNLRSHQISLVEYGSESPIGPGDYLTPTGIADPARVSALFSQGATVIFQQAHRYLPKLAAFCAELEAKFTHQFQTNVYLTPPSSQGFGIHYDTHDVFVLQVAGSKSWKLYSTPIELPLENQPYDSAIHHTGLVTSEFEMDEGDVLYIPRGLMHEAISTVATSLHITLGALTYTWSDLMSQALASAASADPAFRKGLPPGFAKTNFDRSMSKSHFSDLLDRLKETDFDDQFDGIADHFLGTRSLPLPGQLTAMDPSLPIGENDRFKPRKHLIYKLSHEPNTGQIVLRAHGIEMTLPGALEDGLRFALEQPIYCAADIPLALSAADKIKLVKRLLLEGLIIKVADNEGENAVQ